MNTGNKAVKAEIPKLGVSSILNVFCLPNEAKSPDLVNASGIAFSQIL